MAAVLTLAVAARSRTPVGTPERTGLGYWLLTVLGGMLVVGGGYALAVAGG